MGKFTPGPWEACTEVVKNRLTYIIAQGNVDIATLPELYCPVCLAKAAIAKATDEK